MSALQWTNPTRQSGMTILPAIPTEIYLEIFGYMKPTSEVATCEPPTTRDLRNLALVCRYFCAVMIPWIFETIYLDGENKGDDSSTSFCRSILNGDETARMAAAHVRACVISTYDIHHRELGWCFKEFLSMYSKAMAHMLNIRVLVLNSMTITNGVLKAIVRLRHLAHLRISFCSVEELHDKELERLSDLRLKHIDIAFLDTVHRFRDLLLQHIYLDSVTSLACSSSALARQLATGPPMHNLQHLVFGGHHCNPDILSMILSKTPSLKILRVKLQRCDDPSCDQLANNPPNLPCLEKIFAPMSVLQALVPGSPVSFIGVATQQVQRPIGNSHYEKLPALGNPEAEIFKRSSRPMLSLDVPMAFYCKVPFSKCFPVLRSLVVRPAHANYPDPDFYNDGLKLESPEQLITRFLHAWPMHPPLYDLEFGFECSFRSAFEVQDHSIFDQIAAKIPSLRRFTFDAKFKKVWILCEATKSWKNEDQGTAVDS